MIVERETIFDVIGGMVIGLCVSASLIWALVNW